MRKGSVFENNRMQAVRLPAETRFPVRRCFDVLNSLALA